MDRVEKVNLLLHRADPHELLRRLEERYPEVVQAQGPSQRESGLS